MSFELTLTNAAAKKMAQTRPFFGPRGNGSFRACAKLVTNVGCW